MIEFERLATQIQIGVHGVAERQMQHPLGMIFAQGIEEQPGLRNIVESSRRKNMHRHRDNPHRGIESTKRPIRRFDTSKS